MKRALFPLFLLLSPMVQADEWSDLLIRSGKPEKTWTLATKLPANGQAHAVRALKLDGRGFSNIPKEVGECVNLEYLNFAENALAMDAADLAVLAKLPKLQVLILTGNRLASISPEFCKVEALKNLQHLAVDKNEITSVSGLLGNLTGLQVLVLNQNPLAAFPVEAGKSATLRAILANGGSLKQWPVGEFPGLEFLSVSGNNLKIESLASFPANLKALNLARNPITKLTLKDGGRKLTNLVLSEDLRAQVDKAGRDDIGITWER